MRLKIAMENPVQLRKVLSLLLALRKVCVFRFMETQLVIISSALNEPQVWTKLDSSIFQIYDVESARNNQISFELNIEPLYQVLKNFEKSTAVTNLSIRLQRRTPTDRGEDQQQQQQQQQNRNKAAASLALFYTEQVAMNSSISHSFNIPVRLLRKEADERIVEPGIENLRIGIKLWHRTMPLFRRIERYKMSEWVKIVCNRLGHLRFEIDEGERKVDIQWKEGLEVSLGDGDGEELSEEVPDFSREEEHPEGNILPSSSSERTLIRPIAVRVKLKYFNIGARLVEMNEAITMIMHDRGILLHCFMATEGECDITYYLSGQADD